jgi:hypothetical protein
MSSRNGSSAKMRPPRILHLGWRRLDETGTPVCYGDTMEAAPSTIVFVVRIWLERGAGGGSPRGCVVCVGTGERRYFSALADAAEFIAALGAMPLERRRDS